MNEKITPRRARPTLEEVRHRFEMWRKDRRTRGPIPGDLWRAAVEQCESHSVYKVSRALRVNFTDLRSRVEKVRERAVSAGEAIGFVELDIGARILPFDCVVEMESSNGSKMRIYFKGLQKGFDSVELSRAFWRQGK